MGVLPEALAERLGWIADLRLKPQRDCTRIQIRICGKVGHVLMGPCGDKVSRRQADLGSAWGCAPPRKPLQ